MKIEQDDVCVQCGKRIPAQGLGMVCYSCGKEDDEKPMRTDEVRDGSIRRVGFERHPNLDETFKH